MAEETNSPSQVKSREVAPRKQKAVALGGAITTVVAYTVNHVWGINPPAEVVSAVNNIVVIALGYFVKEIIR